MEDEPPRPQWNEHVANLLRIVTFDWSRRFAFHGFLSLQVNFGSEEKWPGLLRKRARELATTVSVIRTLLPMVGICCLPVEQSK